MPVVNVQQAKTQLSRLLNLVEAGEDVVIARNGKQVARLVALGGPAPQRRPGTWRDALRIADDFDEELEDGWLEPLDP
jgi:prevent-host-death family protein